MDLPEFYPRPASRIADSLSASFRRVVARSSLCVKGSQRRGRFTLIGTAMLEEPQRLTMSDVFSLFGRHAEDTRWVASADSQEYLAVVLYLVQRNNAR
jgi:hypothetical protein